MRKWLIEETGEIRKPKKGEYFLDDYYENEDDDEGREIFIFSSHDLLSLEFPILRIKELR